MTRLLPGSRLSVPLFRHPAQALLGQPQLIIVDEPTAGLDPEERNRFLNLLAEIGESVVVILSTHIVEDVADLCPRMAIISSGRIVRTQNGPRRGGGRCVSCDAQAWTWALSASARSVVSQITPGSSRPKWPYAAVCA